MRWILIGILFCTQAAVGQIFVLTGDMTTARSGHSATLLPDGTVLIAGGDGLHIAGVSGGKSAELYDPATETFTRTSDMVKPRYRQAAVLLPNGKVFIAGGNLDATAELYDPATHTFSLTGRMVSGQDWMVATLLGNVFPRRSRQRRDLSRPSVA